MKSTYPKHFTDYCLVPESNVVNYFAQGFVPWGSAIYHPVKSLFFQPMLKYEAIEAIPIPPLSEKEDACLRLLLDKKRYSNKRIAETLHCSVATVDRLIASLKQKFQVRSRAFLVRKANELGFAEDRMMVLIDILRRFTSFPAS